MSTIRVWILGSKEASYLRSLEGARKHDIILIYERSVEGIVQLGSYESAKKLNSPTRLEYAIRNNTLHEILQEYLNSIQAGQNYFLTNEHWEVLREAIISSNPELQKIIGELEALQKNLPDLSEEDAILYDMVWSAIKIFQPKKSASLYAALENWREGFTQKMPFQDRMMSLTKSMIEAKVEGWQPVDTFNYLALDSLADNFNPRFREQDSITHDYQNPSIGLSRQAGRFAPHEEHHKVILRDEESQRELLLLLAHRTGSHQEDIAGSDFIYVKNDAARSMIFVQYKHLKDTKRQQLELDGDQLHELLQNCQLQGCRNFDSNTNQYKPIPAMRLHDCAAFYKYIYQKPQASSAGPMAGSYIQACIVNQLSSDQLTKNDLDSHNTSMQTFFSLMRKDLIGSNSNAYEDLSARILSYLQNAASPNIAVAVER